MKARYYMVVAVHSGEHPNMREPVGCWWVPCRLSIWNEPQSTWAPLAAEIARRHGYTLASRFERWPDGCRHRASVYGGLLRHNRASGVSAGVAPARCTSPYHFPAIPAV